jgi:hypothetical protein
MKAYGVRRRDRGCCPGHDKFPREKYNSRRSQKARARDRKIAHQVGRARLRRGAYD